MWVYDFPEMIKVNLCRNSVLVSHCMAGSHFLRPLMKMGKKVKVVLLFNVFCKKAHRLGILRMLMEKSLQHIILHNVYLSFCVAQVYYLKTNTENVIQKT